MRICPTHHEIAELSAHLDAASARLLELIREFDARDGWNNGHASCAHWLAWRVGLDLGAARERVRVARALGALPRVAQALARGELSYAKVRALTRVATPETEERLLAFRKAGTAAHVERLVRGWRRMDRKAEVDEAARQHRSRAVQVYREEDGTVVLRGRLAPGHASADSGARHAPSANALKRSGRRLADAGAAAGRRAGAARRDRPPPWHGPRRSGRTLPGRRPYRRRSASGCRAARPVGPRRGLTRFRGNVPALGVRCQSGRDAA